MTRTDEFISLGLSNKAKALVLKLNIILPQLNEIYSCESVVPAGWFTLTGCCAHSREAWMSTFFMELRRGNLMRTEGDSLEAEVSGVSAVLMSATEKQQKLHGVHGAIMC